MLHSIKSFFDEFIAVSATSDEISEQQIHIATAALLIEMMHMDNKVLAEEYDKVISMVRNSFSLSTEQAAELIELAEQQLKQATDYFQFTSLINKNLSLEKKIKLIQCLWEVAFSDGHLDEYEDFLVRKVSGLLHIPHSELIKMRNRVLEADGDSSSIGC